MKNIREIYQALLDEKKLINKRGSSTVDISKSAGYTFNKPEDWEIYDNFKDLKRVHEEGARIELYDTQLEVWVETTDPIWSDNIEYRIKGDITFKEWGKYKDLIKAWWDGAEMEYYNTYSSRWLKEPNPEWTEYTDYRIKDGIAVEEWDRWKKLIKKWWRGANIQFKHNSKWEDVRDNLPTWSLESVYRIKPSNWDMEAATLLIKNSNYILNLCEGFITEVQKIGMKFQTEEAVKKVEEIVSKIYDSVGTCKDCCLRGEQDCPMVSYRPDLGWIDESVYNGYCHKFTSKRKDKE
jgi:hypothetical protein